MLRTVLGCALFLAPSSAHALSCGDTITSSVTLTADLHCTTGFEALYVTTPGITIDLNGHTLSGTSALRGIRVLDAGVVTIRNGTIHGFWGGITGLRAHKIHIENVTFKELGVAISLNYTADARIVGNRFSAMTGGDTISFATPTGAGYGAAGGHIVDSNYFEDVFTGISVCGYDNRGLRITKNEMLLVHDYGIHAFDGSGAHYMAGNIISSVENTGVVLRASSDNEITGNVIRKGRLGLAFIPELTGFCRNGPVLDPYVSGNLVDGNTIADLDGGLTLGLGSSSKALVFKNNIHFNKIYDDLTGIYFREDAQYNDATGNAYSGTATPVVDMGSGNTY